MANDCYIGRKTCGCIAAVVLDNPDHAKQVAKDVAGFIRAGLTVERAAAASIRSQLFRCQHEPKKPKKAAQASLFKQTKRLIPSRP